MVPVIDTREPGKEVAYGISVIGRPCKYVEITNYNWNTDNRRTEQNNVAQLFAIERFVITDIDHAVWKAKRQHIRQLLPDAETEVIRQP